MRRMSLLSLLCKRCLLVGGLYLLLPVLGWAQPKAGIRVGTKVYKEGETITICIGSSITYFNEASGNVTVMNWKFNKGTPDSYQGFGPPPIVYNTGGTDTTWQIVTDGNRRDTIFILVKVTTVKPDPDFTFAPAGECGSTPILFTNNTTGGNSIKYSWNFGDGKPVSSEKNPAKIFETAPSGPLNQTFQVKLVASNEGNCTDSITRAVTVIRTPDPSIVNGDPNIEFLPSFNGVPTFRRCENISNYDFVFRNATITPAQIVKYVIKWGDGSPDTTFTTWPVNPANLIRHKFPRGNSSMTVIVTGNDGCEGIRVYNVFVGTTPAGGFASLGNTSICAPNALNFIISQTKDNAPGTLYKVNVNDNSPSQVFLHPAPDTVTHVFEKTSCDASSSNGSNFFQNAYRAILDVENPCGTTSVSVIPIYVSGKPKADFLSSTGNDICVNTNVAFRDNNAYGGKITPTGGTSASCDSLGKLVWSISPATGYTVTSGNYGSVNGRPDEGFFWTSGSQSLSVRFTQTGEYRVKIYAANELCGVDSSEEVICVRTPPTASFSMDKKNGCAPAEVSFNNTSPTGDCGGDVYRWNISYEDPLGCGPGSGYTFTDGTNDQSKNPKIRFTNAGTYFVSLTVFARASGCVSAIYRDTFYAVAKPKVTPGNFAGLCAGNALNPTAIVTNCYGAGIPEYLWTFAGGTPASSNLLNPGPVNYPANGSYEVKLDATNDCGTTTVSQTVIVAPRPVANAGPNREVCSGTSVNLGAAAVTGVSYSWSPSAGLNNANVSDPTLNYQYTGSANDTTVQYVVRAFTAADCFTTDTVLVKVKRSPVVTVSPSVTSLCTGGSTILSATGADSYSWSPAAGLSATDTSRVTATPALTTTYIVTGSLANGCQATANATVTIVSFIPGEAGPAKEYCSGLSTTIGIPSAGMNYSWQPSAGLSSVNVSNPTVSFVYSGTSADTVLQYVLTASAGANCRNTDTVLVTVKRTPVVAVNPAAPLICTGGSTLLTASGAVNYTWSPATGLNATDREQVTASPVTTTVYTITGSLPNGCTSSANVPVTVISRPVVDAGRDTIACNNAPNVVLTGAPSGGVWSGSSFVTGAGVFNPRNAGNGNYKLYYTFIANGCDGRDSMVITVQNPPNANAGRDTSLCADGSVYWLTGIPGGGTWSGSPLVTSAGDFTASTPGTYNLVYSRGSGSCIGYDTVKVTVVNTVSNNTITATQGVCGGVVPAPLAGSNATAGGLPLSYQWQSSPDSLNWTNITGETGKDLVIPSPTQTIFYRRLANTAVCTAGSPSNVVKIFIHPDALADINPAPVVACSPFLITPAVINLTTYPDRNGIYRWFAGNTLIGAGEVFPGFTINNPDDSIIIKLVTISLFGCVNDSVSVKFKTISNPTPSFTLSDTVGCGPLNIAVTNTTPRMERYTFLWNLGNGQTFTGEQPGTITYPINPSLGDTIYTVILKATGGCDTFTVEKKIRVRARPRTLFTPDKAEGCSPFNVTFNNNSAGSNASFTWDFGDGSPRVPAGFNSVNHTYFTGRLDTFRVRLYGTNDCGTDTGRFNLVVNPNRVRLDFAINGDELNGCAPHTVTFINNTTGANLFRWDFGDGSPVLTTNKGFDTLRHTYTDTGRYTITLFGTNGCSDTTSAEIVNVSNGPEVSFSLTPNVICLGSPFVINNTSEQGLAFSWSFGDGTTSTLRQPVKTYGAAGSYRIVLRGTRQFAQGFSCTDSAVAVFAVNAPTGDWRYRGGYYCQGQQVSFEVTNSNATRYRFYFGNGDSLITNSPAVSYLYPQPGSYLPRVVLEYNGCSLTLPGTDSIRMDRTRTGFISLAQQVCGSTTVSFSDTSSAFFGIGQRNWSFGDGTGSTQRNPSKVFTQAGSYPVSLFITGVSGCTDSVRMQVVVPVQQPPVVSIDGDTSACVLQPARFGAFDAAGTNPVFDWQIAGGANQSGASATNTWVTPGSYLVRLIGRTAIGCADTAFRTIRVNPSPNVVAGNDITICRGQSTRLGVSGGNSFQWSPVQGLSCSDCATPMANPNLTTQYFVTGTNTFGCSNTDSMVVNVAQPFNISVTSNDTLCISRNETAQLFASTAHRFVWSPAVGLSSANVPNPVASPASTTTYRVIGFDAENCFTDTAFVTVAVGYNPAVTIPQGRLVVAGTEVALNPTITGGPFKRYTWTPNKDLSCSDCPSPVATINNNIQYRLEVETIYGCTASDTTSYTVQCQPDQVFVPNAFSPDGDGINDVLMVRGKGVSKVKSFRIFNRVGQVVFERQNFNANDPSAGWDGRVNGVPASPDVYVFTAEVLCTAGANYTYKGNITLFR